ncbi:MAG: biopolymer transporter ExbD [Bacteriovoracaceae bacterium]|nr:biopolymer transporter ExbD [Bacteriovoracaceae bacterium]
MAFTNPKKNGPISEINVTPLVDVMLVLLVIFMVTAPMMFSGVKLDLPKTRKVNNVNLSNEQVILSVNAAGEFYLGKNKFLREELNQAIVKRFKESQTDTLYLRADYQLKYGNIADLIAELKKAGVHKIALVTEIKKK